MNELNKKPQLDEAFLKEETIKEIAKYYNLSEDDAAVFFQSIRNWCTLNVTNKRWSSECHKTKAITSYGLKHVCERGLGRYVENNWIKAALYLEGFSVRRNKDMARVTIEDMFNNVVNLDFKTRIMEQNKIESVAKMLAEGKNMPTEKKLGGEGSKGHLVVIDSKPPVADNTTLMLYTVKLRAVDEQKPTVYFSLEDSSREVCNQLIAIITGIDQKKITDCRLSADEWLLLDEKLPLLQDAPLYIDDTPALSLANLKRRVTNLVKDNGVGMVVVNHLQELTDDGQPASVHRIIADIKSIAEELGITIIVVQD